jgi:hypothetical protein
MYREVCSVVDHGEPETHGWQRIDTMVTRHSLFWTANRDIAAKVQSTGGHDLLNSHLIHIYGREHR